MNTIPKKIYRGQSFFMLIDFHPIIQIFTPQ